MKMIERKRASKRKAAPARTAVKPRTRRKSSARPTGFTSLSEPESRHVGDEAALQAESRAVPEDDAEEEEQIDAVHRLDKTE
jgi:hypothetical protein